MKGQDHPRSASSVRVNWSALLLGFLVLLLAHGAALLFRIQPAVSLWFPPSGVAIALALWLGPLGIVLTGLASVMVAPAWGGDGWFRLVGLVDVVEPAVAWLLYRKLFGGSLTLWGLHSVIAFLLSAPLAACAASATVGCLVLTGLGRIAPEAMGATLAHWWLGNALGTMTLVPVALLLLTPLLQRRGWLTLSESNRPSQGSIPLFRTHGWEGAIILALAIGTALMTVFGARTSIFLTLQLSLLGFIPVIWAAIRFGVKGGILTASLRIFIVLLAYLIVYPQALNLPFFPVDPELLHTHKLSLLLQGAIALLVGTAISERVAIQSALAEEQVRRAEYETRAQFSEELLQLNRLLSDANTHLKEKEAELRRSEALNRAVLENFPNGAVFLFDADLRYLLAEGMGLAEAKRSREQLVGRAVWEVVSPATAAIVVPAYHRALAGESCHLEIPFGDRVNDVHILPLHNSSGVVIAGMVITQDITERKRAEERLDLAQSVARIGSFEWDIQSQISLWSPEIEALYGLEKGTFGGTYEDWAGMVHAEDLPRVEAEIGQALQAGELFTDWRVLWPDGSIHWLQGRAKVLFDSTGQPLRMVGINVDISASKRIEAERQLAEVALRQSEMSFRTLADAMPQMFWITQPDGYHEYFNQRWYDYTGATLEQTRGEGWQTILHPDDIEHTQIIWQDSLQTGNLYQIEYRLRQASNGEYRWHLGRALPLRDEAGHILKWFGSCTDIHDQKLAVEERVQALERERAARLELERAGRMKDEFLAIVSHELRSPLNAILGWSRLLRDRKLSPEKTEQALASIERNAQAQTQLIEDLLDISRIIRGKIRLHLRPLHLATVVQAAVDTVQPTASTKSICLKSHLDTSVGLVSGDSERLQQVVWNLLSNAIKFTPDHGEVTIALKQVDTLVQIQVRDTGNGIQPDFLPHVFDRFRQADASSTRSQGGLGLGLAIVRNLVELHGGTAWAESAGEGQGATFIVALPLLAPKSPSHALMPASDDLSPRLSLVGLRVMVVDDEADTREFLLAVLEEFGAVAIAAASAQEAFTYFQQDPPDILISDIGMPQEDGFSLIRKIRTLSPQAGGQIPAAALTAYVRGDDQQRALAAGFQMHIGKPVEPLKLVRMILQLAKGQ
ncbi:MAG: PAS domain-containing protein [Cyanobacteria bacterium Co-bin8]|nr:PAS domain-containing protein [Cyanobacteria bacterium Co-bin8]